MVADEDGHKFYDESIDASGPMEACGKAISDAKTAYVAESEDQRTEASCRRSR